MRRHQGEYDSKHLKNVSTEHLLNESNKLTKNNKENDFNAEKILDYQPQQRQAHQEARGRT